MLSKELVAASTTTLVLSILSEREDYGYALIQRVNELSGGQVEWSEGMLYPVLHWMEKEDLIESEWRAAETGHRRKYYRLRKERPESTEHRKRTVDDRPPSPHKIMENPKQFDLNEAIRQCQQNLAASPAFCADDLEELASHLCVSAQRLKATGLSEEESFLIASRRLGGADKLSSEFSKLNFGLVWQARAFWMLAGMLVYLAVFDLARLASAALMALCGHFMASGFSLAWTGGAAFVAVIVGAACILRLVAAGRLTPVTFSMGRLLRRQRIALPVVFCVVVTLKVAAGVLQAVLYRTLQPIVLGQAFAITAWLSSIGGVLIILLIVVALTMPALSRHARAYVLFVPLLLCACGLTFLITGCNKASSSPASGRHTLADQAIASWNTDTNAAVEKFLEIDWNQRPLFDTGNVLDYSEAQFIAIPAAAKDSMSKEMLDDLQTIKAICRAVNTKGNDALAKGDQGTAERCFNQLKQCGAAFDRPESLIMLKLVGQAINKLSTNSLAKLK